MLLEFESDGKKTARDVKISQLVIAGWAGRDLAAVEAHIVELEELGVKRPPKVPVFYFASRSRATCAGSIEVLGGQSSGEVECVLLQLDGEMWVGVGSDHTDRQLEIADVPQSKQICEKPVAATFWKLADVEDHWDSLRIRSFIVEDGKRVAYQDSSVAHLRPPSDLMALYAAIGEFAEGMMMFCGTAPVIGGIRPAGSFEFSLEDPVLGRAISGNYDVTVLPEDR